MKNGAIASILIVAILAGAMVGFVIGNANKQTTTSVSITTTTVNYASSVCLKEVPENAVINSYSNSTSQGYVVTYPNGTEDHFPLNACPVPVTPDNYWIDSIVEANPEFIAAENGSTYEATNACNCVQTPNIISANGSEWTVLNFVLYSNRAIYPCGGGSDWTYYRMGLILVTIPISPTGSFQFSNAQIQSTGAQNEFPCTTTAQTT